MPTITLSRDDVTADEVSAALRDALGARYHVMPGKKVVWGLGEPEDGQPDDIAITAGSGRVTRTQVRIDRRDGETRLHVAAPGPVQLRLVNALGISRKVQRALRADTALAPRP